MATFAPKKKIQKKPLYNWHWVFIVLTVRKFTKNKDIGPKGFWGKILQKWAYLEEIKSHMSPPYLGRILNQKLLHILTSTQIWLIPLVDDFAC